MLQATLRAKGTLTDFFQLRFEARVSKPSNCQRGLDNIVHKTVVLNPTWGSRIRRANVRYWTDSTSVRLCSGPVENCSLGGEEKVFQIPARGQEYWAGDEKAVEVKACWADLNGEQILNLSYAIEIEIDARGMTTAIAPVRYESNTTIQVA